MSVDEFERARNASRDKRYERAATGRRDNNTDNNFRKKKAISRWESAYKHQTTTATTMIPQGESSTGISLPSTTFTSSLSPPVQPIRLISPLKKCRTVSQTLCQDLTNMLSTVSDEVSGKHVAQYASPTYVSPRKSMKVLSMPTGLQESLALNFLKKDRISTSQMDNKDLGKTSEQIMTTYSIENPLGFYSPVKKRTALRLPTDTIFRDVREMMIRSSLSAQNGITSSLLLVNSDDTSCSDEIDSLYDIDSCSEHSFDDDGDCYEDFTATSYGDESCSEDASFVSAVLQQSLEVQP